MIHSSNVLVSGSTFTQINHQQESTFKELSKLAVLSATHDSGETFDRPGCHENTRVAVLRRLWNWTNNVDGLNNREDGCDDTSEGGSEEREAGDLTKPIMWVYGDAGAGKSALAQSHAERCAREGRLLGSFFFSRNDTRRTAYTHLVATIAYQAATVVPELKDLIVTAIAQDPNIFGKKLETQFAALIVNPINSLSRCPTQQIPHLIIIDGLDECTQNICREQSHILKTISQVVVNCSVGLKVLVASRTESEIRSTFDSNPLCDRSIRLALDASFRPDNDVRIFLNDTFWEIKETHTLRAHIPPWWPGERVVDKLVRKSSGQFIYASTAAHYISSPRHKPTDRLDVILGLRERASDTDIPFAALDALYCQILSAVLEENVETIRNIFGLLIFDTKGFDFNYLDNLRPFLSLTPQDLYVYLMDVVSIVDWKVGEIYITHASLSDFLLDQRRSGHYHLQRRTFFTSMVKICVNHFNHGTSRGLSGLSLCYALCSKYVTVAMRLSLTKFTHFCKEAGDTPELRETLLALSLRSIFNYYRTYHTAEDSDISLHNLFPPLTDFVINLFKLLQTMMDNRDLVDHHLKEFDQCMMKLIPEATHDIDNLLLIMTLSSFPRPKFPRWDGNSFISTMPLDLSYPRVRPFLIKGPPISPEFAMFYDICTQYRSPMTTFFSDPSRSAPYTSTATRYADAALCCLVYLCQNAYGLRIVPGIAAQKSIKRSELFLPAYYALTYLPQLLFRAVESQELTAFIRSGDFERLWEEMRIFHVSARGLKMVDIEDLVLNALQACEDYLQAHAEVIIWSD